MVTEIALDEIQVIAAILAENEVQVPVWSAWELQAHLDALALADPTTHLVVRYASSVGFCLVFNENESLILGATTHAAGRYYGICRQARCLPRNENGYEGYWLPLSGLPDEAERAHLDWAVRAIEWLEAHTVPAAATKKRRKEK